MDEKPHALTPSELADLVVKAYIKHDGGKLDESAQCFSAVFRTLFPEISYEQVEVAAKAYVESLRLQDAVEDNKSLTPTQKIESKGWLEVRKALETTCDALKIPNSYALETSEFFKFHGVKDCRFIQHLLNAERILCTRIRGDDYWANELGALYLGCVRCHDKHDANGFKMGRKLAEIYYSLLMDSRKVEG